MKLVRRLLLILLILILIGWTLAWFVGRSMLQSQLEGQASYIDLGEAQFQAQSFAIDGFPFYYRIRPQQAALTAAGSPSAQIYLDDRFGAQVSLPGSAWGVLTGAPVGARLLLPGLYEIGPGLSLEFDQAWIKTEVSDLSLFSGTDTWRWDGLDLDLQNLRLSFNQAPVMQIDRLRLDMDPQVSDRGIGRYGFDLVLTGLEPGSPVFEAIPNRLDQIRVQGRLQPDLQAAYINLISGLAEDPFGALALYGTAIGDLVASEPGVYLDQIQLTWGQAELLANLSLPFNIQPLRLQAVVGLEGQVSGQNFASLLQALLREPAVQGTDLPVALNSLLIGARRMGVDLETGTPATLSGTLLVLNPQGISPTPGAIEINGNPLTGF